MTGQASTLDLREAARLLHMSPSTLREKAKARVIPGAKPGKRWVFLESDLVAYLRSLYGDRKFEPDRAIALGNASCRSIDAEISGGCASRRPVDAEYAALLGLPIANRRRSSTTS